MDTNQNNELGECGDLLVGAGPIRDYLVHRGMPPETDPYYLKRTGRWPIGKTGGGGGGQLIASKRKLDKHIDRMTRGSVLAP